MKKLLTVLLTVCTISAATIAHAAEESTHNPPAATSPASTDKPVNINTANESELTTLKGVGSKKAVAIVQYRAANGLFKSIDDLSKVKGFSEKMVKKITAENPDRIQLN